MRMCFILQGKYEMDNIKFKVERRISSLKNDMTMCVVGRMGDAIFDEPILGRLFNDLSYVRLKDSIEAYLWDLAGVDDLDWVLARE